MVLKQIRYHKNKMRIPLMIMVAILAVGLVGSFAIWSSPDLLNPANPSEAATPEEQIQNLQAGIVSLQETLKSKPKDFATLSGLADAQYQQGQLYDQLQKSDEAKAVIDQSLQNYLLALENPPAELNAKGQADLMVKAANAAWYAGQEATADTLYQQSMGLVPDDFTVAYQYALYLALNKQQFSEATAVLETYKAKLPAGDERIASVDSLIKGIDEIKKAALDSAAQQDSGTETAPAETETAPAE